MHHNEIATLVLNSPLTEIDLKLRLETLLVDDRALPGFIERLLEYFGEGSRPSLSALGEWISSDQNPKVEELLDEEEYEEYEEAENHKLIFNGTCDQNSAMMAPDRVLSAHWNVPSITTLGALAHWLNIPVEHLDWYCGQLKPAEIGSKLSHYHLVFIPKRDGSKRLLEVPKWELKQAQRYVLDGILEHIPTHPNSHGFQKNRSIMTYVKPHVAQQVIIKFDLQDYFLSATRTRTRSLFHLAGYPPRISQYLSHLCTHNLRGKHHPSIKQWRYEQPHLPQGAPSSPAIADRLLFKLDVRLSKLAEKLNLNYTRYADDMAFSSARKMSKSQLSSFQTIVHKIIAEEGWTQSWENTRYAQ